MLKERERRENALDKFIYAYGNEGRKYRKKTNVISIKGDSNF